MANLCGNQLTVRGEAEDITRFLKEAVSENVAEETVFNEFTGFVREEDENRLELVVISRHSPPLRFLVSLSRQFPTLTFYLEWREDGVELFGSAFVQEGVGLSVEQGCCLERWQLPDDLPEGATALS